MTNRIQRIMIFVVFASLLMMSAPSSVMSQTDELNTPDFIIEEQTFETNEDNDLYVRSNSFNLLFNNPFSFEEDSMDYSIFDEDNYNPNGNLVATDSFNDAGTGVMQFLNQTADKNELTLERRYYSLTDEDGNIEDVFITAGESYVFSVNVEEVTPMFFEVLISQLSGVGGGNSMQIALTVVTPSGDSTTENFVFTRDIVDYIPFFPQETGSYQFSLSAPFENGVIGEMTLDDSPDIEEIERSISERLQGDETVAKFIRIGEESTGTGIWDLDGIVYIHEYLSEQNSVAFGNVQFLAFIPDQTGPLGTTTFPNNIVTNGEMYVAVIATPASPDDPDVRRAIEKDDTPGGLDVEYTLSARRYQLDSLPLNEAFETNIKDPYSVDSGERIYSFSTSSDIIVGINSTDNTNIDFVPFDPEMNTVTINAANEDFLNDLTADFAVIPAGEYYVTFPVESEFQISTFETQNFDPDTTTTFTGGYGDIVVYYLAPSDNFFEEYLNVTYSEQQNRTALYQFSYHTSTGNSYFNPSYNVSHYYENSTADYVVSNLTSYDPATLNTQGLYLAINITANAQYNTTGYVSSNNTASIQTSLTLSRLNSIQVDEDANTDFDYQFHTLSTSSDVNRNVYLYNTSVLDFIKVETSADKAYKIVIDSLNDTLQNLDFLTNGLTWNLPVETYQANISGVYHYYYVIQFVTTTALTTLLSLDYGNPSLNDTIVVSMEEIDIIDTDSASFTPLEPEGFLSALGDFFTNPWVLGGIGVIAIGTIVFVLVRRGVITLPARFQR